MKTEENDRYVDRRRSSKNNYDKPRPTAPCQDAWFTPQPYPYQVVGAIEAATGTHPLIADEPGLGKTTQALLATAIRKPQRTLILCPPALTTNWTTETHRSHIPEHMSTTPTPIHTITAATPTPKQLPDTAIIITPDTLTTARPKLATLLTKWQPNLLILDEAHRFKNPQAKRTKTMRTLAAAADHTIALTGTPIVSNPLDIYPLIQALEKTQHFPHRFINTYTTENYWGQREPNHAMLPDLHRRLNNHVWIRRTKSDVLAQLPAKSRHTQWVDAANLDLHDATTTLIESFEKHCAPTYSQQLIEEWATNGRPIASALRRATGLAKISAATEWIDTHHAATGRPLIAWCIHTDVITSLQAALAKKHPNWDIRTFYGATPHRERDTTVQDFQDGKIHVLICQIIAAGTGLTLTVASEALFVETDWVPANVVQAEDRIHRISQTLPVTITTLLAPGTLDPVIHRVLAKNIRVLDTLTPGSDHKVTNLNSTESMSKLLTEWADDYMKRKDSL